MLSDHAPKPPVDATTPGLARVKETTIRFKCPCGQRLKTRGGTEGRRVRCANCLSLLRIPEGGQSSYETVAEACLQQKPGAPPAAEPPPASPTPSGADVPGAAEPAAATGTRILVADSNPADRRKIVQVLRARHYTVLEADDGPKALELIRAERPTAVLLNVKLDVVSGFQVVQQLRSPTNALNRHVRETPVLMTAERLNGRDKQYSMSIGAQAYLVKPLQPAQIFHKLDRIAANYRPQKVVSRSLSEEL